MPDHVIVTNKNVHQLVSMGTSAQSTMAHISIDRTDRDIDAITT